MAFSYKTQTTAIVYNSNNHYVDFDISFGMAKDSVICKNDERKYFNDKYNIEVYEIDKDSDTYQKGYRVVANEGPFAIKISNININSDHDNYDYALGFAIDNKEPKYYSENDILPYNIERDGTLWTIPANNTESNYFDQNPKSNYQWVVKKALDKTYVRNQEEKELGIEETTEDTGLLYLTFMIFRKEKSPQNVLSRGVTRGITRSVTRSVSSQDESVAGRFGYGNEAKTLSTKSEYKYANGTERYVLPIRTRININSEISNINCSETIKGAEVNMLKTQTMKVPF